MDLNSGKRGQETVADPGGPVPPFWIFFYKSKVYLQKLLLNEYKICLKMLEWPDFPRKLKPSAPIGAPPENPGSAPGKTAFQCFSKKSFAKFSR